LNQRKVIFPKNMLIFKRKIEDQISKTIGSGKILLIFGPRQAGVYVLDHCEALRLCLFKGKPGEVYNIGADNELNNLQITDMILSYFKQNKKKLEFIPDRPGHDRRYAIDASKIKKELGWKPRYHFKKAFKETIDWYITNKVWVENVRQKTGVFNPHIDLWEAHNIPHNKK